MAAAGNFPPPLNLPPCTPVARHRKHRACIHLSHSGRRTLAAGQRSIPLPERLRHWHCPAARHAAGLARHFDSVYLGAVNFECGDSRFGCVTRSRDDRTCPDARTQIRISSSRLRRSEPGVPLLYVVFVLTVCLSSTCRVYYTAITLLCKMATIERRCKRSSWEVMYVAR